MLQDKDTYSIINRNPIRKISVRLRDLLKKWKDYITAATYKNLSCSDGILPRAYGLPKIHKRDTLFRIIISSINSPLYFLASYLHKVISTSVPKSQNDAEDSFQLVKKLSGTVLNDNNILISLDIISLFTNIPIDLAIDSVANRWEVISANCNIPKEEFIKAVSFVLDSTYFVFNNIFYKQTFGTPMGSPLSLIIADLVMRDLEERALEREFECLSILDMWTTLRWRYLPRFTIQSWKHLIRFIRDFNLPWN